MVLLFALVKSGGKRVSADDELRLFNRDIIFNSDLELSSDNPSSSNN